MVRIKESAKYQELRLGHANRSQGDATDATDNATDATIDIESQILLLVRENNAISFGEIASLTGKHRATIARKMKALKESGKIVRLGGSRDGHWEITQD